MAKYSTKLVKKIIGLIESDFRTIKEVCSLSGISKDTYYTWLKEKPDFSDAIKGATAARNEKMVTEAKRSLFKLIQGYYYETERTLYVDSGKLDAAGRPLGKAKEWVITKKYVGPRVAAIIFVLCNLDPEHWKNVFRYEITGKGGSDIIPVFSIQHAQKLLRQITDQDLDKKLIELEKKNTPPGRLI